MSLCLSTRACPTDHFELSGRSLLRRAKERHSISRSCPGCCSAMPRSCWARAQGPRRSSQERYPEVVANAFCCKCLSHALRYHQPLLFSVSRFDSHVAIGRLLLAYQNCEMIGILSSAGSSASLGSSRTEYYASYCLSADTVSCTPLSSQVHRCPCRRDGGQVVYFLAFSFVSLCWGLWDPNIIKVKLCQDVGGIQCIDFQRLFRKLKVLELSGEGVELDFDHDVCH